jgi:hypothetical protein
MFPREDRDARTAEAAHLGGHAPLPALRASVGCSGLEGPLVLRLRQRGKAVWPERFGEMPSVVCRKYLAFCRLQTLRPAALETTT